MRYFFFLFLIILFSQYAVIAQDNLKYKLSLNKISSDVENIYISRNSVDAKNWIDLYANMDSTQYVQYVNYQAMHASVKYGITLDDAICILANRINYSEVLFGVMPNKLTLEQLEKVASFMHYAGLIISPDPSTWGNGKIEKDFVVTLVDKNPVYRKTAVFPAKSLKKDCYLNLATSSKDNFLIYMIGTQYLSVNSAKESLRLEYSLPMILITLDSEDFLSTLEVQLVCPTMKCKEKSPTTAMNNNL